MDGKCCYKLLNSLTSPYLADDCQLVAEVTRCHLCSADTLALCRTRSHTSLTGRLLFVASTRLRNGLPTQLRLVDIKLGQFKQLLKIFLFCSWGTL